MSSRQPYGINPEGNRWLSTSGVDALRGGLGKLRLLDDSTVLSVLRSLGGVSLGRAACVSRACYVLCHFDDLWRDLTLTAFGGAIRFRLSWKTTWVETAMGRRLRGVADAVPDVAVDDADDTATRGRSWDIGQEAARAVAATAEGATATDYRWEHDPIVVEGIFSDYLYQWWRCASSGMDPAWVAPRAGRRHIERCSAKSLSADGFAQRFGEPNVPVVIEDCVTAWPAFGKWSFESFAERFGSTAFHANGYTFTMDDYIGYARGVEAAMEPADARGGVVGHDRPLYLFDSKFTTAAPALASEYSVPPYFTDDLFHVLGEENRPNYRWLIVGPARSGSIWHTDPNATSAWNAVVTGAKKWILYPPECVPPGVHPSPDRTLVGGPLSPLEWLLDFYDEATGPHVEAARRPLECVCRAGEVIYVPTGWWHAVINLEPSIAITQNFVDRHNLPTVMKFLRDDIDLISGVPGRTDAQVAALASQVEAGIKAQRPDLAHLAAPPPKAKSVVESTGLAGIAWQQPAKKTRAKAKSGEGSDAAGAEDDGAPAEKKPCFRFGFNF